MSSDILDYCLFMGKEKKLVSRGPGKMQAKLVPTFSWHYDPIILLKYDDLKDYRIYLSKKKQV